MSFVMSRREVLSCMAALTMTSRRGWAEIDASIVKKNDRSLGEILERQETDSQSRWRGGCADSWGLYPCGSAAQILHLGAASYFHPESSYFKNARLFERMKLAAEFLERMQNEQGNIDLLTTNFNSPPDTGFVVHRVANAAKLAALHEDRRALELMENFLRRAGAGLAQGGIHTPNHRWVVCAALAQIHDIFPDERHLRRIDEWLAEGIDLDEEGQFIERSTTVYNPVCDYSLVVMADKLNRPELLAPVRKNLDAMLYLLHPNFEVVTEISRRQDLNTRGGMERYWLPLRYMANHDGNGKYAAVLQSLEPDRISLPYMMEYPILQKTPPGPAPVPDRYVKDYPLSEITRIRDGKTSATILHRGGSRWISIHRGEAVINAIRFASAFFGKGQFVPERFEKRDGVYYFKQELRGPYYQPISDPNLLPVSRKTWGAARSHRRQSEVCAMTYEGSIKPKPDGFDLEINAHGTGGVPLAVEINLREGGELTNVQPAPNVKDAYLLSQGYAAYRAGDDVVSIGPGRSEHAYTQIRGAEPKLPGVSVYVTGYTPFQHKLTIRWG
ncbi:MAG: hypothetical protein JXR73_11060 [Candidatus Omnitrophica bacterium]|nr:hypothetical protein [Candidatus Omnitrophota bacterium]